MRSKQIRVKAAIAAGMISMLTIGSGVLVGVGQASGGDPAVSLADGAPARRAAVALAAATATADQPLADADRPSIPPVPTSGKPADKLESEPPANIDRLVLVGDSLAQATAPVIQYLTPGKTLVPKYWGGTAPCDWVDTDLEATATSVVVVTFTGNSLTDCMSDGAGGHLIDERLVEQYRVDVGMLIRHALAAGAWVVLVGQPHRNASFDADLEVDGINAFYRAYAATMSHVSYVDAGRSVETPDGRYTDRLPCTPYDTDCAADGTTVVRGDGVHFCPIVGVVPCPVWSSGAFRFGMTIAAAANDPQILD